MYGSNRFHKIVGKNKEFNAYLYRAASSSFVLKIAITGVGFISSIVLARTMGAVSFGIYSYVLTWVMILVLFAKVGLQNYSVRFVSQVMTIKKWSDLKGFVLFSFACSLMSSLLIALAILLFAWFKSNALTPEQLQTVIWGALLLIVMTWLDVGMGILRGLKHVGLMQVPWLSRILLFTAYVAVVYLIWNRHLSADKAMLIHVMAAMIALIFSKFILYKKLPLDIWKPKASYQVGNWTKVSLTMLLTSAVFLLNRRTDTVMIGLLSGTYDAGIYFVATRIAEISLFGTFAIDSVIAPLISESYEKKSRAELQELVTTAAVYGLLVLIVLILVISICSPFILKIYGEEFVVAKRAIQILLFGQAVNALAGPVGFLMTMTGNQKVAAKAASMSALANICLNYLLIPRYGIEGAAIATTISAIIWNVILFIKVKSILNISPGVFGLISKEKP